MRNSLSGIINLVIFIILIFIAVFLYNSNNPDQAKKDQNAFIQKAVNMIHSSLAFVDNFSNSQTSEAVNKASDQNFWSDMGEKIKEEWNKSDVQENGRSASEYSDLLRWEKNATGAEMIFKTKNGEEHKLELPFKFLSK